MDQEVEMRLISSKKGKTMAGKLYLMEKNIVHLLFIVEKYLKNIKVIYLSLL